MYSGEVSSYVLLEGSEDLVVSRWVTDGFISPLVGVVLVLIPYETYLRSPRRLKVRQQLFSKAFRE